MLKTNTKLLLLGAGACLALAGCGDGTTTKPQAGGKLQAVATIPPLTDWVKQVGGEHVEVTTLLPPGASPHVFEPTTADMRRVSGAGLFVRVGLHMDDWAAKLARAAGAQTKELSVGDLLAERQALPSVDEVLSGTEVIEGEDHEDHDHGHSHEGVNPHFWLDPQLAKAGVELIREALAQADPTHAPQFAANAARYTAELDALDKELSALLAPERGKGFVSFHNAYPYLAQRYGLKVAAVIEESPGKAPSERYVRRVADKLRALQIKTIFSEPQLSPRAAEILADAVGGRMDLMDPYGSENHPKRDTYLELMRFNAGKLKQALAQ